MITEYELHNYIIDLLTRRDKKITYTEMRWLFFLIQGDCIVSYNIIPLSVPFYYSFICPYVAKLTPKDSWGTTKELKNITILENYSIVTIPTNIDNVKKYPQIVKAVDDALVALETHTAYVLHEILHTVQPYNVLDINSVFSVSHFKKLFPFPFHLAQSITDERDKKEIEKEKQKQKYLQGIKEVKKEIYTLSDDSGCSYFISFETKEKCLEYCSVNGLKLVI